MRALTADIWAQHAEDLAGLVLERWPALTSAQLDAVGRDYDALARAVADAEGTTVEQARTELGRVRVDERAYGSSDPGRTVVEGPREASLARLRLGHGFGDADRDLVVRALEKLERRLATFPADATDLEVSVKDRGETSQRVTLDAWLPRLGHVAATSHEPDLQAALADVRQAMWRQVDDALGKRRPYE